MVGPRPAKINCSNALNFMTSTDAIAAKNAFVLITNKFVIKTNAFFAAMQIRAVMKFKALGNCFAVVISTTVRGCYMITILLEYFKLTAWIAANVDAYVHGHKP